MALSSPRVTARGRPDCWAKLGAAFFGARIKPAQDLQCIDISKFEQLAA